MWLTAEHTWIDDQWHTGLAVELGEDGRIRSIGPRPSLAPSAAHTALVPAAAWPLSSALPQTLGGRHAGSAAQSSWRAAREARAQLFSGRLELFYVEILTRLGQAGVALAGLVLPAAAPDEPLVPPWPGVTEACRAIARTGVRAALLFTFDEAAAAGRGLDELCARFDAGVREVLAQRDSRATWAMCLIGQRPWPGDALVSLRLRLGHLPLLVPLDAADGPCGRAWLPLWRERRCADATVTFVAARAPEPDERHLLHDLGCQWLDTRGRPSHVSWGRRMQAHGASLSLRAGVIAPGRWADVMLVEAASANAATEWLQRWPDSTARAAMRSLYVAGVKVPQ